MGWRDFKPNTPTDKIDLIDKNTPPSSIVDIVDIVDRYKFNDRRQSSVLWKNHFEKGNPEAQHHSREAIMDAVMISAKNEIVAAYSGKQFRSNDGINSVESMITEIYHKVLKGEAKLREFNESVRKWVTLCINESSNEIN